MPTTSFRSINFILTLATLSAFSLAAAAQSTGYMQSEAAPIERSQAAPQPGQQYTQAPAQPRRPAVKRSQPAQGIWLSVSPEGSVTTVAATADRTELRVDSGIANISVHHPAHDSLILVDLGSGQIDLIKDGLYTFNAQTKTARVLVGEAGVFSGTEANSGAKPIKLKEDHALTFGGATLKPIEFAPFQAGTDLLPRNNAYAHNDGGYPVNPGYGYGSYGDGFYGGYPYSAYGYGYPGWGYPYGFGLGFGYYGGFGGFYGRGFGGGGFRGRR